MLLYRRRLLHQVKAQLRRKSQQVQESLVSTRNLLLPTLQKTFHLCPRLMCFFTMQRLDIEILERLASEEIERREDEERKREQQRLDAQEMRDVMRKQLELEKQREEELDSMYR